MDDKIVVAALGDSPRRHTGFGTVNRQLLQGFHEAGMEVHVYGFLDRDDDDGSLPYNFYPVPPLDDLGHATYGFFLRKVRPDVIFILTDPGNIDNYMKGILEKGQSTYKKYGQEYTPPTVVYTPIEGWPSPESHGMALYQVEMNGGTVVVYCESAKRKIISQFDVNPEIVNHGLDHANFRKYSCEERKVLRQLVGLDDYFVIGSIGVNKRTKGFPTLIYAAQILRKRKQDEGIKFYCHTNPYQGTMGGHNLKEMVNQYGVADMFLFKQGLQGNYWQGVEYEDKTLEYAMSIAGKVPETSKGRGFLWQNYDLISKINCFDLYVDASQVEGWGLPLGEAMACGVPCVTIHDDHVRDEIYRDGAYFVHPLPSECWGTWHSSIRLVTIDPTATANAIIHMKENPKLREECSLRGMQVASRYKWQDAKDKMTDIVINTVQRDRMACQLALEEQEEEVVE